MTGGPEDRMGGERVYRGRVIHVDLDRVRFPDGSTGELEMVRHPGASAVVPLTTREGTSQPIVTLVRQYRYAAGGYIWEIPAGKLDAGEPPEDCARRELEEETGLRAGRLEALSHIHTTPGFTDEVIHLFVALELAPGRLSHEPNEFIELHERPLEEVMAMVVGGEITDAKTICALALADRWWSEGRR
ncbi:MAG: NUDIX hydrolase [Gemmatimonadetes bacterium]|nr:NUDIX hydrolase [Gemmatimonadota bacterium]